MTEPEFKFMQCIFLNRRLPLADRVSDKMRQRLRKQGLIECVMNPRRWVITDEGAKAYARHVAGL